MASSYFVALVAAAFVLSPKAFADEPSAPATLQRLTRFQYQRAAQDLFVPPQELPTQRSARGLRASYFSDVSFSRLAGTGVNETIDFAASPSPLIGPDNFSVLWEGSLLPWQSGTHSICVTVDDGATLRINGLALVETWGPQASTKYCGQIDLRMGVPYPLQLTYFQYSGPMSVHLTWIPPGASEEVIPSDWLLQPSAPIHLDLGSVNFPGDDLASGFEVGRTSSTVLATALQEGSEAIADTVVANLNVLFPCSSDQAATACAQNFIAKFLPRAYRRSITSADQTNLMALYATADSYPNGIRLIVQALLQSPEFLFAVPMAGTGAQPITGVRMAEKLARYLWGSIPDEALLSLAVAGGLDTPAEIGAVAAQMLKDPKAQLGLMSFFKQWLQLPPLDLQVRNRRFFPWFTPDVSVDIDAAFDAFVRYVVWETDGSFERLMKSNEVFVDDRLGPLFGITESIGGALQRYEVDERAGILTQPRFLVQYAAPDESSPIRRGVTVLRQVLCDELPPPPDNIPPLPPGPQPGKTTRAKTEAHTASGFCQGCHGLINPIGFAFENFDEAGTFRALDNGKVVDASGKYVAHSGQTITFSGASDMMTQLTASDALDRCFVKQVFRFANGRRETASEQATIDALSHEFSAAQRNIPALFARVVTTDAFLNQPAN